MGTTFSSGNAAAQGNLQESWERRMEHGLEMSSGLGSQGDLQGLTESEKKSLWKLKNTTASEARKQFEHALRGSNLFKQANRELVTELFDEAVPIFVKKDQVILEKGAVGQVMFIVVKGAVSAHKNSDLSHYRLRQLKDSGDMIKQFQSFIKGPEYSSSDDEQNDLDSDNDFDDSGDIEESETESDGPGHGSPKDSSEYPESIASSVSSLSNLKRRLSRRRSEMLNVQVKGTDDTPSNNVANARAQSSVEHDRSRTPEKVVDSSQSQHKTRLERNRTLRGLFSRRRIDTSESRSLDDNKHARQTLSTVGTGVSNATSLSSSEPRETFTSGSSRSDLIDAIETVEDKEYGHVGHLIRGTTRMQKSLGPGRAFGTHCVLVNTPHSWTVSAKRDTLLLAIHRVQFQEVTQRVSQRSRLREDEKEREGWLLRFPFLAQLKPESLSQLAKEITSCSFAPGEVVCGYGEPLEGMYVVMTGTLAFRSTNGEEVRWFHQGDCVGRGIFMLASDKLMARCRAASLESGLEIAVSGEDHVECIFLEWKRLVQRSSNYPSLNPFFASGSIKSLITGDDRKAGKALAQQQLQLQLQEHKLTQSKASSNKDAVQTENQAETSLIEIGAEVSINLARDALQSCPLFALLDMNEISDLAESFELCIFDDDDEIFSEGDALDDDQAIYLILHGVVELSGLVLPFWEFAQTAVLAELNERNLRNDSRWSTNSYSPLRRGLSQQSLSPDSIDAVTFAPPGVVGRTKDQVLLLDGDTFGEECLERGSRGVHSTSCKALGAVVCARIPKDLLERVGVLEKVQRVYLGAYQPPTSEINRRKSSTSSAGKRPAWRRLAAMSLAESFSMSDNFLLLHDLLEFEPGEDGTMQARRRSLMRTINRENLKVVSRLHETRTTNVFLALHAPTIQLCVVKSTNVERANEDGMGRFVLTEQTILSQVESPFIIKLLSAWNESPSTLVALEPALAGSLEHRLTVLPKGMRNQFGGMPFHICRFFAAGILMGLKHLYELRIVHRDIKTVNILVDHHGYPKLADFGVSKALDHRTSRTATFVGSPRFMAPEQAALASGNSSGYGIGVDWWAFGCVLYKIATGEDCFSISRPRRAQNSSGAQRNTSTDSFDSILGSIMSFGEKHRSKSGLSPYEALTARRNDRHLKYFCDGALKMISTDEARVWRIYGEFVAALLHPDAKLRLGANHWGPRSAQYHPLFLEIPENDIEPCNFDALFSRHIPAPWVPRREDLIVDVNQLRRMHKEIRLERRQKKSQGPSMQVVMEDDSDSPDEEDDKSDSESHSRSSKRLSGSAARGMNLLTATKKMQALSVATLHTVTSEVTEADQDDQAMADEERSPTIEEGVRHRLEIESNQLMGPSLRRKRQLREEMMLANRRRAKILELKRRTQMTGSIGAAVLYRVISAEEHHQGMLSQVVQDAIQAHASIASGDDKDYHSI